MVFYISEGSPDTVLSDARISELLQQVPPRLS
jgi:aromatic ring-opening dioxygenase catalytic subunit (LigB family)